MGTSGLLGVRMGPAPHPTASSRLWRHMHLLKGVGDQEVGLGVGRASLAIQRHFLKFDFLEPVILLLLLLVLVKGCSSTSDGLTLNTQ